MTGKYSPPIVLSDSQIRLLGTDFRIELARSGCNDSEVEQFGDLFEGVLRNAAT